MIDQTGIALTNYDYTGGKCYKFNLCSGDRYNGRQEISLLSLSGKDIIGKPYQYIEKIYDEKTKHVVALRVQDYAGAVGLLNLSGKSIIPIGKVKTIGRISEGMVNVRLKENGPFGFMNMQGNWIIQPKYFRAKTFSEGRAFVLQKQNAPVHMIDNAGKIVKEFPDFLSSTTFFGSFREGLAAIVDKKNKYRLGYINTAGEWVIDPLFDGDAVSGIPDRSGFHLGLAPVCTMEKPRRCGFIDKSGRWVIEPKYIDLPKHFQ